MEIIYYKELLSIFERRYYSEIERKDKINSSMSIPIAILAPIVGFYGYNISNVKIIFCTIGSIVSSLLFIFLSLFLILSIIMVFKTLVGYEYGYLPYLLKAWEHLNDLDQYYKQDYFKLVGKDTDELFKADFYDFILSAYIKYTDMNIRSNISKLRFRYLAHVSIFISFILTVFIIFNTIQM